MLISAMMRGLIADVGGYDAVVAYFTQRTGQPCHKGTLSQKKNGTLDWTLMDVIILQEFAQRTPVTDWLVSLDDDAQSTITREAAAARVAVESGELVAALIGATTPEGRARALKELGDVREAIEDAEDVLERRS